MKADRHRVKLRACRLTPELDAKWQEYLEANHTNHNSAVRKAIESYLFNYYPKAKQND